jgi:hypothetical protein
MMTLLTWDFDQNMEHNQFSTSIDEDRRVGYHLVKGMNKKLNYFIDQYQLVDLEYGVPTRQVNVNQLLCEESTHMK